MSKSGISAHAAAQRSFGFCQTCQTRLALPVVVLHPPVFQSPAARTGIIIESNGLLFRHSGS